jgi:hypothetical protein
VVEDNPVLSSVRRCSPTLAKRALFFLTSPLPGWPPGMGRSFRPQLTADDVPRHEMGAHAVELLVERIAAPTSAPRHLLLASPISLRDSTGFPQPEAL